MEAGTLTPGLLREFIKRSAAARLRAEQAERSAAQLAADLEAK
jgi:hypothetical protein